MKNIDKAMAEFQKTFDLLKVEVGAYAINSQGEKMAFQCKKKQLEDWGKKRGTGLIDVEPLLITHEGWEFENFILFSDGVDEEC